MDKPKVIFNSGIETRANYNRVTDKINIKVKSKACLIHELAHATGHQKRLNRVFVMQSGLNKYDVYYAPYRNAQDRLQEELTAIYVTVFFCWGDKLVKKQFRNWRKGETSKNAAKARKRAKRIVKWIENNWGLDLTANFKDLLKQVRN